MKARKKYSAISSFLGVLAVALGLSIGASSANAASYNLVTVKDTRDTGVSNNLEFKMFARDASSSFFYAVATNDSRRFINGQIVYGQEVLTKRIPRINLVKIIDALDKVANLDEPVVSANSGCDFYFEQIQYMGKVQKVDRNPDVYGNCGPQLHPEVDPNMDIALYGTYVWWVDTYLNFDTKVFYPGTKPVTGYDDVPPNFWAFGGISAYDNARIAGQCADNPRQFCPGRGLRRDVMAKWLVQAARGADYTPAAGTGQRFSDVPSTWWAASWVEEADRMGIDQGFGTVYQPSDIATRAQLAVALVRARYGANFTPPPATGTFSDLPAFDPAAPYVELLQREGVIVFGCNGSKTTFCPNVLANRAVTALLVVRAFDL